MLKRITEADFDSVYSILSDSFPKNELRPEGNMKRTMENKKYIVYKYGNDDIKGTTAVWELDSFLFVEYLAVNEKFRNNGIGSEILKELFDKYKRPLCLEVEPPESDITKRRIEFYKRNNFYLNHYPYEQPAYSQKQAAVPLMIMTSGGTITKEQFLKLRKEIYKEVYNKTI